MWHIGSETVAQIMKCDEEGDYRQIRQIVEVSMRKLQNTPLNPDPNIYLSLIYSAKVKPKIFANSIVWDVSPRTKLDGSLTGNM